MAEINKVIYLDNAANTLINPEVLASYNKVASTYFANPSSIHLQGQKASHLLETARKQIASSFACPDHDVIFTSGATEANNLAIKGVCLRYPQRGKHIITSSVEHPSVLEVVRQMVEVFGYQATYLPVNERGVIRLADLQKAIREDTVLVSLMAVNNETGAINPIHEIATLLKKYPKITFHVDAVQALGKIELNYQEIDMFSFAGHKIHGLNSCGGLIKRKGIELTPLLAGGGQEMGYRSGSNDVAMATSLAKAVRLALANIPAKIALISPITQQIRHYLQENDHLYEINSSLEASPFIINFSLKERKASVVVEALSNLGIMISSTSACHAHDEKGSYVMKAMGRSEQLYMNTLRVSLDEENTSEEITSFLTALKQIMRDIKQ